MNRITPFYSEVIHDSGSYQENGRAYYEGDDTEENKANYFEYEELETPGRTSKNNQA